MVKRHRTLVSGGVAGLILVAVSLLAVLGPATPAQAQIDISGEWNFEILGFGPEAIACPSTIEQTDATFTVDTSCTDLGFGTFVGEIDVETGEFTATGNITGMPIELAGTASQDGETIEGTWDASSFGFSGTLSAVRKPPGPAPTPLPTLPAPIDATGTWRINFTGAFSGSCDAVIEQNDEELSVIAMCPILGTLRLGGTIDPVTGAFRLSGFVSLEGRFLSDDDSLTGTWSSFGFGGSLTGERVDDFELLDFSGEWAMVLLGDVRDRCALGFEEGLVVTSAVLNCEELGQGSLEGAVDPFDGFFFLAGPVGETEITLSGQLSADGGYIFGSLFSDVPAALSGHSGPPGTPFVAVPAGTLERGIVLIGCQQGNVLAIVCSQREQVIVDIGVPVAPVGGYTGIETTLSWSEPLAFGEATPSGQCDSAATVGSELSVSLTCSFAEQSEFVGNLFSITLTCDEFAEAVLDVDSGILTGVDPDLDPPTIINSTISCFGPVPERPPLGDADCSFNVNSIDAALILQFEANLLEGLDCWFVADVNFDDTIDSRDALIILQSDAGLFELLG
ncbi:MAG: dockerin type I repeat-containing protein [Chloroflexi bacterium]|nr:dockerin type I repeat-containing protein [Chloroflexota bacterium]MCI0856316.1 dockerin type I repeat-containing protein [Chloroflexota bacterium]MCI0890325.1 dockerin type I repeat-containing protein [Chloroflexota bacterium]